MLTHDGPGANDSVWCYRYDKIRITCQQSLMTVSFPCTPYCAKALSNSSWIHRSSIGGFKVFGSGQESCSWEVWIRYFSPSSLTGLFYLEVREPLRNREKHIRKRTLIHELATDIILSSFKETRSHGLLQSEHRCSFGWNARGLPHHLWPQGLRQSQSREAHPEWQCIVCGGAASLIPSAWEKLIRAAVLSLLFASLISLCSLLHKGKKKLEDIKKDGRGSFKFLNKNKIETFLFSM